MTLSFFFCSLEIFMVIICHGSTLRREPLSSYTREGFPFMCFLSFFSFHLAQFLDAGTRGLPCMVLPKGLKYPLLSFSNAQPLERSTGDSSRSRS